jgi:hypothetical protein
MAMSEQETFLKKLETWVENHPEEADAPTINLTTQKEFTLRGVLAQLIEEETSGVAILDEEVLQIKEQIKKWIEEM